MPKSRQYDARAEQIIRKLDLKPHPEGGFFRETYRSIGKIRPDSLDLIYTGERNHSTCIYFLLTSASFSALHRIHQDEIWHFYDGSPIHLHTLSPEGYYTKTVIGRDIDKGELPQVVVPGGTWFGATVVNEEEYSLVGCTVAPGFDFRDFEPGERTDLAGKFPEHQEIIKRLTRD